MRNILFALLLLPCAAQADRITEMNRTDLCTYSDVRKVPEEPEER